MSATIEARVRAAWADRALGNVPAPPDVDVDVWWRFASMADNSIYPHCLSHVDHTADWDHFEAAGLIRGALAVYTTKARSGLRAGSGMLSAKHADKWAAFETVG